MQPQKKNRPVLAIIILVSLVAIFLSIVLTAVLILFVTSRLGETETPPSPAELAERPFGILEVDKIDPALALISLGGVPEEQIINNALEKSRPETALSTLLFAPFPADRETAGNYIRLADIYQQNNEHGKATFAYQQAGDIAIIAPDIPDNIRADIILLIGEGLVANQDVELGKLYLEQAFNLASYSPYLQATQRRAIFERLNKIYLDMGERALARQSLDLSANPPLVASLTRTISHLPPIEPKATSTTFQEVEANRWQKTQQLAALLVERSGNASDSAYNDLREALLKEDEQKLLILEDELAATTQVSEQINILAAQIQWLTIKYKVAQHGYGVGLVPEWEGQTAQIESELNNRYARLFGLYDDLIVALPDISQINEANQEKLPYQILYGELGLYPNYPQQLLRQQLMEAVDQTVADQPDLTIRLTTKLVNDQERYIFEPVE
ncbi:hypothetical protein QUF63_08195 [Anaerolineales bacterium HSG25]|nr:hypothetical protein [Anaerolineales bacterium HSG25]